MNKLQQLEALVWENFYSGQDITSSITNLQYVSEEKAQEVREEIKELIYDE